MHLVLKCIIEYEISYIDNIKILTCAVNDVVLCECDLIIEGNLLGFGINCRTNQFGLFPINKFILFDSTNNVKVGITKSVKSNQSSQIPGVSTPGSFHRMIKKSIGLATMCSLCGEYIIGIRPEYNHCILCNQVFHGLCWTNHLSQKKCQPFFKITNLKVISYYESVEVNISDWSKEQIFQWLCSVNMFRLLDLFDLKSINGQALLSLMPDNEEAIMNDDNNTLYFWSLISDKFYRQSLYNALLVLLGRTNDPAVGLRTNPKYDATAGHNIVTESIKVNHIIVAGCHHLREVTFLEQTYCYYCSGLLLGIHKQGFHCIKCRENFHKMCAAQINISLCPGTTTNNEIDLLDSTVFGVPLENQLHDQDDVPKFLKCCIKRLESRQRIRVSGPTLLDWYSQSADTKELIELRSLFSHPIYDCNDELVGLSEISDHLVAKLVKLFFKELPEPLLPYGLYHSIVDGIKFHNDDQSNCVHIHSVLRHFPAVNKATLQLLVDHFEYVCQGVIHDTERVKEVAIKWSYIFSKTLIWPPHIMLPDLSNLKLKNQKITQFLFEYKLNAFGEFKWSSSDGDYVEDIDSPMSQSASSQTLSRMLPVIPININVDIKCQDWYWSDTSKDEVNDFMAGQPDGSFLVRDSANKTLGDYTLTVRKDGENKLIRIIFNGEFYGFQEPYRFKSVAELIHHFQVNKLSEYNEKLNITLRFPVSKTKSEVYGHCNDLNSMNNDSLIELFKKTMEEYSNLNRKIEEDSSVYESYQKELDEVTKTIKGVALVQTWCYNHTEHIMNAIHSNQIMRDHSRRSLQILNIKLKQCDEVKKSSNERREYLTMESTKLISSLSLDKPKLKKLNRQLRLCNRQMRFRGVPDDTFETENIKLDELCEKIRNNLNNYDPINDQSTWYIEDITRPQASSMLHGKRDGTFLVRKSKERNSFALDIVVNNCIQHCLIYCCDGKYGFVRNDCPFESLAELVRSFHLQSLEQYNAELKTKLVYPVNYSVTSL